MVKHDGKPERRSSLAGPTSQREHPQGGGTYADFDSDSDWVTVGNVRAWDSHVFRVRTELIEGKPRMVGLCIEPRADADIRDAVLSRPRTERLPIGELTAWAAFGGPLPTFADVLKAVRQEREHGVHREEPGAAPERPRGGSDEFSQWIADVWLWARERSGSGQRAIARKLDLDDPQPQRGDTPAMRARRKAALKRVERYVDEARRGGKLPPAEPRKRKG